MRALHRKRNSLLLLLLPVLLAAILLVGVCVTLSPITLAAENFSYLTADITYDGTLSEEVVLPNSGTTLPSVLPYRGGASYRFSFKLYESAAADSWDPCKKDIASSFVLKYNDGDTAPTEVGVYTLKLVATADVNGYKLSEKGNPVDIASGTVVAQTVFKIVYENIALYNSVLDEKNDLILADGLYDTVLNAVTVTNAGKTLTKDTDYTLTMQKEEEGVWTDVPTEVIDEVPTKVIKDDGVYRINVTFTEAYVDENGLALNDLQKENDAYILHRAFIVVRPALSLKLTVTSLYEDDKTTVVALTDASASAISAATYTTAVLQASGDEKSPVYKTFAEEVTNKYKAFTAGSYLYRITFSAASGALGVEEGDVIDLPFTVDPIPYTVSFEVLGGDSVLEYTIRNTEGRELGLAPHFYTADGKESIDNAFVVNDSEKFAVSYVKYIGDDTTPVSLPLKEEGVYLATVTLGAEAVLLDNGAYTVKAGKTLAEKEFQIIGHGLLTVKPSNDGVNYYTGSSVVPALDFSTDPSSFKYSLTYYNMDGTVASGDAEHPEIAPAEVGSYRFVLTFTQAVSELGILAGDVYRGEYTIAYRTLAVTYNEGAFAFTGESVLPLEKGKDYSVLYYDVSDNVVKRKLASASHPSSAGKYVVSVRFLKDIAAYNVKTDDVVLLAFEKKSTSASIFINFAEEDKVYDGGVKVPAITFSYLKELSLKQYEDYSVVYYKYEKVVENYVYVPCDYPVAAGKYKCLVTFLKGDEESGIRCGAYKTVTITVSPRTVNVVRLDKDDFVYNGDNRAVSVELRLDGKLLSADTFTVKYKDEGEYGEAKFSAVGEYYAKAFLKDDKEGSLVLSDAEFTYKIVPLLLKVSFTGVPVSYDAMYSGAPIKPTVSYVVLNGENAAATELSAAQLKIAFSNRVDLGDQAEKIKYYNSFLEEVPPTDVGEYTVRVTHADANVVFMSTSAVGTDGKARDNVAAVEEGVATLLYSVLACEVKPFFTFSSDLYYTGEAKGVTSVVFKAYNASTKDYTTVINEFQSAYDTTYASCSYDNTLGKMLEDGVYKKSASKPTAKGYYFARLTINKNDAYLAKFTLVDGYDKSDTALGSRPVEQGCYVEEVFRIKDQTELNATISARNEYDHTHSTYYKVIDLTFIRDGYFPVKDLAWSVSVKKGSEDVDDVTIDKMENGTNRIKVPSSEEEAGDFTVAVTFTADNTAYRIASSDGEYVSQDENCNYIATDDLLTYFYKISPQKTLEISWRSASVFYNDNGEYTYYNGVAKQVSPFFEVTVAEGLKATVPMTKDTHYSVVYYAVKTDEEGVKYEKLDAAPVLPGEYVAELVFLSDLPDYRVKTGTDGEGNDILVVVRNAAFTSVSTAKSAATFPRYEFTVKKAVLEMVKGVSLLDKTFDGTTSASFKFDLDEDSNAIFAFDVKKDKNGAKKGAIVNPVEYTGTLIGTFASIFPASNVAVEWTETAKGFFALSESCAAFYEVEYPTLYAAINKVKVTVTPVDVTREYDYSAVNNYINFSYDVACADDTWTELGITKADLLTGELYRTSGITVGEYDILSDKLSIATDVALPDGYEGKTLQDLFELKVVSKKYRIVKRTVTVQIANMSKIYGASDPTEQGVSVFSTKFTATSEALKRQEYESYFYVVSGSLVLRDKLILTIQREEGENAGTYTIFASTKQILNGADEDVGVNYALTVLPATDGFTIERKQIQITITAQNRKYLQGFNPLGVEVYDLQLKRSVTQKFIGADPEGDHLAGALSYSSISDDNPYEFAINQGTLRVVNKDGKNITSNYDITYVDKDANNNPIKYTIVKSVIHVTIKADAKLTKYYGDADPIIGFTVDSGSYNQELLGNLEVSALSTLGREAGEEAGRSYALYADNRASSLVVFDGNIDVSAYFDYELKNVDGKAFRILPRPITVTVQDATFENTWEDVSPVLLYLNEAGEKLSSSIIQKIKVQYAVPSDLTLRKGANAVTPVIVGDVTEDANFDVTLRAGTVTMVYLEDEVTATVLPQGDEIYYEHKYVFAGFMLYKPVCFYKLTTSNGLQPSEDVEIALPIDSDFKGTGYVAVALYNAQDPKAFALTQAGRTLIYTDDGAYYVAIAEVQEWFYAVLGVAAVLVGVILFLIVYAIVKAAKKRRAKLLLESPELAAKKAARKAEKEAAKKARDEAKETARLQAAEKKKTSKKALREQAKLEEKEREALERAKRKNEIDRENGEDDEQIIPTFTEEELTAASYMPTGDSSALKVEEPEGDFDIFLSNPSVSSDDLFSSENTTSDMPEFPKKPNVSDDDDLVISKSANMFDDEEDEKPNDDDMI